MGRRTRRHTYQLLSPELVPNGRYARGADPKYAAEDAANPMLVDARYSDGAHFRAGAVAIHVNWCVGLDRKVQHLKDYGLWFLTGVGLYKLRIQLARSLRAPDFNPRAFYSENLVSKFSFKFNLCRYAGEETKSWLGIGIPAADAAAAPGVNPVPAPASVAAADAAAAAQAVLGGAEEDGCRVLFATYPNSGTSWIEQMVGLDTTLSFHHVIFASHHQMMPPSMFVPCNQHDAPRE